MSSDNQNTVRDGTSPNLSLPRIPATGREPGSQGDATEMKLNDATSTSDASSENDSMAVKPSEPKMSQIRYLYNQFVHVKVGTDKKTFIIHKGLLCQKSAYFNAALNGSFEEALAGEIDLPEEEPEIFEIVYHWLYSDKLTETEDGRDVTCSSDTLIDLYIFGEKYAMPSLCNKAIDGIISEYEHHHRINVYSITHAYKNTPKLSLLRKVLVNIYTRLPVNRLINMDMDMFHEQLIACPEFLWDVSIALMEMRCHKRPSRAGNIFRIPNHCQFHRHAEGEAKCPDTTISPKQ